MKKIFDSGILPVLLFTCSYLGVAAYVSVFGSNFEFVIYIGVVILALCGIAYMNNRFSLPLGLLWGLSLWGLLHMAGGLVTIPAHWPSLGESKVLYNLWLIPGVFKYDQAVHAYGFGITTWLIWEVLRKTIAKYAAVPLKEISPTFGLLFLCVIASMGLGALNEVVEFMATITVPDTNVGGYYNTGWDLVSNMAGAVIVAFLIHSFHRRKS